MKIPLKLSPQGAFTDATNAFVALSRVYLECTAQLSQTAIVFSRETVQHCLSTSAAMTETPDGAAPLTAPFHLARSLMDNAVASTRDGYEAVLKAQRESARIISSLMGRGQITFADTDEVNDAAAFFAHTYLDMGVPAGRAAKARAAAEAA